MPLQGPRQLGRSHRPRRGASLSQQQDPQRIYSEGNAAQEAAGLGSRHCWTELFGHVKIDGSLNLRGNDLTTLPESMGSIQVGGGLDLSHSSLPRPTKADFPNVEGPLTISATRSLHKPTHSSFPDESKTRPTSKSKKQFTTPVTGKGP
jgi:hypothetical protein